MPRTVPGFPLPVPDRSRFFSALPIRAADWQDVGDATNIAWYATGLGTCYSSSWRPDIAPTGPLRLRVPVASPRHAYVRVHAWGEDGDIRIAGFGAGDVALPGTLGPAVGAVVDMGAAVVLDAGAGHYLDIELVPDTVTLVRSVAVELLGDAGTAWPGASHTLPAWAPGDNFVPADRDEVAADLDAGSDWLVDRADAWAPIWGRRQQSMMWAQWESEVIPPHRKRGILRRPQRGGSRVTIAIYVDSAGSGTSVAVTLRRIVDGVLGERIARVEKNAGDPSGWYMATEEAAVNARDFGSPARYVDALMEVAAIVQGMRVPADSAALGFSGDPPGDSAGQGPTTAFGADIVRSIAVWVG
jgi:hypothetical protein